MATGGGSGGGGLLSQCCQQRRRHSESVAGVSRIPSPDKFSRVRLCTLLKVQNEGSTSGLLRRPMHYIRV